MRQAIHFPGRENTPAGPVSLPGHHGPDKRSEERISKLLRAVDESPVRVVITDRAGTIEYVNPCFTQITGYTAEEAIGQNPRILNRAKPRQRIPAAMGELSPRANGAASS